jgi:PadR family transcriptional regulator PadR
MNLMIFKTLEILGRPTAMVLPGASSRSAPTVFQLYKGNDLSGALKFGVDGMDYLQVRVSANKRRSRYYSITRAGRKQLAAETKFWPRMSEIMTRLLNPSKGGI